MQNLINKGRQILCDPVLRSWVYGRVVGNIQSPDEFTANRPPYIENYPPVEYGKNNIRDNLDSTPNLTQFKVVLPLLSEKLTLTLDTLDKLKDHQFVDRESELCFHRFAWVPAIIGQGDPDWIKLLWSTWVKVWGCDFDGWAWHPYTAAERAINILDFSARFGYPGGKDGVFNLLFLHAKAISQNLEYYGEHNTSNHLANNGRGLYRLGLELELPDIENLGFRILEEESKRIFLKSGILRENSSHYHLLYAQRYLDMWLQAKRFGKQDHEAIFFRILESILSVIPELILSKGLPLIGDISPDCPPQYLYSTFGLKGEGWLDSLPLKEQELVSELFQGIRPCDHEQLRQDGWLKVEKGPWSGMWHIAPDGWSAMPGHGHQDCGSFELHCDGLAVFIDPGRGEYGETGESAYYRSAEAHNTLLVNRHDPYPPNKPYYDDDFRQRICGPKPQLNQIENGVAMQHSGYSRLSGVKNVSRDWLLSTDQVQISDCVDGAGNVRISRILVTQLQPEVIESGLLLAGKFKLSASGNQPITTNFKRWTAYGHSEPAYKIEFQDNVTLPWKGDMLLELA